MNNVHLEDFMTMMNDGNDVVLNIDNYNLCLRFIKPFDLDEVILDLLKKKINDWKEKNSEYGTEPFFVLDDQSNPVIAGVVRYGIIK